MFGYIKPQVAELKVKENEFYKAVYCGLCKALGQKSKLLSFTLSYDFVFLAIVKMAVLKEKQISLGKKRCMAHPFKKRSYLKSNPCLESTARAAALLLYYNLLDDINDSKGFKKLVARLSLPKASKIYKRNLQNKLLDEKISHELSLLSEAEKNECSSVYELAEPFGRLLGAVFTEGCEDEKISKGLYAFGRHIGRWIYIVDALDDIEEDKKSGSFNALIAEKEGCDSQSFENNMRDALIFELIEAEKILSLFYIEDEGLLNIIKNILCLGMPENALEIIKGESKNKKKRKGNSHT